MAKRLRALMSLLLAWRGIVIRAEQCGGDKTQHGGSPLRNPLPSERIESHNLLHHGGTAEIENDEGDHRGNEVHGIDRTKFAVRDSLAHQFADSGENRLEIGLDHFVDVWRLAIASPHHLALHKSRIHLVGSNEVEICARVGHYFFSRAQVAVKHTEDGRFEAGECIIEHSSV